MVALASPGRVIEVAMTYSNEGSKATNVYYIAYAGQPPSVSDFVLLNADFVQVLANDVLNQACVGSVGNGSVQMTDLASPTGLQWEGTFNLAGTLTGTVLPGMSAVCVRKEITRRYRGGHPRTYLMCGSASTLSGTTTNFWQNSFIENIKNGMNTVRTAINGVSLGNIGAVTWVTVWRKGRGTAGNTAGWDPITGFEVDSRVCTQRRRLGKVLLPV